VPNLQVPPLPYTKDTDKDWLLHQFFQNLKTQLNTRKHLASASVAAAGTQPSLTFRSNVKAVVTSVGVVLGSVSSATLILTLLYNGSVTSVLTLSNSANEVARTFVLTEKTLDSLLDRLEIHAAKDKGDISVIYDYRILG
jgi:hypothetical protein